jgi:putative glycosyltransferase
MLSIVTTSFNSSSTINEFILRSLSSVEDLKITAFEIIVVDDGSDSFELNQIERILSGYEFVRFVKLTRNFGHHQALLRGLEISRGDRVFLIDSDLEEDPRWLPSFMSKMQETAADVVYGVQRKRRGNFLEVISGRLYYWLVNTILGIGIPNNFMTVRLMKRSYVDNLTSHREYNVNLAGLMVITGHSQVELQLNKVRIRKGDYSVSKKFQIVFNSVTSFSERPLIILFGLGCFISILTWVQIIALVVARFIFYKPLEGWLSLFVAIQFFGGLSLIANGIVGLYVSKIFTEVKARPRTLELD